MSIVLCSSLQNSVSRHDVVHIIRQRIHAACESLVIRKLVVFERLCFPLLQCCLSVFSFVLPIEVINEISCAVCFRAKADEATAQHLNPLKVLHTMEDIMSSNTIMVADGGDFVATAAYILR